MDGLTWVKIEQALNDVSRDLDWAWREYVDLPLYQQVLAAIVVLAVILLALRSRSRSVHEDAPVKASHLMFVAGVVALVSYSVTAIVG